MALKGAEMGISAPQVSLPRAKALRVALQPTAICQDPRDPLYPSSLAGKREAARPGGWEKPPREELSPEQGRGQNRSQVTITP